MRRVLQTQTLSTAYGAALTIPKGAREASITLNDATIGFTVQDQGTLTAEEAIPAGSSWTLSNPWPLTTAVVVKIKSASGTPVATVAHFQ